MEAKKMMTATQIAHQKRIDLAWKHKGLGPAELAEILEVKRLKTARSYIEIVKAGMTKAHYPEKDEYEAIVKQVNRSKLGVVAASRGLTSDYLRHYRYRKGKMLVRAKAKPKPKPVQAVDPVIYTLTRRQMFMAKPFAEWGKIA